MENESTPQRYVSFSWLIGAFGSVLILVTTIVIFSISHFASAIDKKVDKELFNYVCADIKSIKEIVNKNAEVVMGMDRNLAKTMQKLNIEPERR